LTIITQDHLMVLVLEDLQWSDTATVEAMAYLARRQDPLKLLLLGTYRPADLIIHEHPLRQTVQELAAHQLCRELRLELLNEQEVRMYVAQRLGSHVPSTNLADVMYRRTEGNAFFTVQMLSHLLQQGLVIETSRRWWLRGGLAAVKRHVPEGLRTLMIKQLEALDATDQLVLEAASVGGVHFVAAEVAAGLLYPVEKVETICDRLTQHSLFLEAQELVTWPDGTSTVRYGFRHALYRDVIYDRLGMAQRSRLHRLVGERLESGYVEQAKEMASELALHFECGQDFRRAIIYRQYAAQQSLHRSAYREALMHGTRGLQLVANIPERADRMQQELRLRYALNVALTPSKGIPQTNWHTIWSRPCPSVTRLKRRRNSFRLWLASRACSCCGATARPPKRSWRGKGRWCLSSMRRSAWCNSTRN
jgi:predicted ATPase